MSLSYLSLHSKEYETMSFRPKYITFDCYGTLTRFRMGELTRDIFADRVPAEQMEQFIADFSCLPLRRSAGRLATLRSGAEERRSAPVQEVEASVPRREAQKYYDAVPTWGPHEDVPAGLAKVAKEIPLVILSNAWTTRSRRTWPSLARPFTASTRRSRPRPTSRA